MQSRFDDVFEEPLIHDCSAADQDWIWRSAVAVGGTIIAAIVALGLYAIGVSAACQCLRTPQLNQGSTVAPFPACGSCPVSSCAGFSVAA